MLRRTPIIQALDPRQFASGLAPDLHDQRTPLWIKGDGVRFVNGKVIAARADDFLLRVSGLSGPVYGLTQQRMSNSDLHIWFVINRQLYRWDRTYLQLMKSYPVGVFDSPYFEFVPYGDWLLINRQYGPVEFWNGATFTTLGEMPNDVVKLQKFLSFMIALGTGSKKTGVSWSDANDISKWIPTTTNSAGSVYIDEFEGGIVGGARMGTVLAVYSANQMAIVSFIGSPFYFGQKVMQSGIGLIGPRAVAAAKDVNYGMGRQGAWVTDGAEYRYLDDGVIQEYFQENINWAVGYKVQVSYNSILRTIEYLIPTGTSTEINECWSFDPQTGGWSQIPLMSWFDGDVPLGYPIVASTTGDLSLGAGLSYAKNDLLLETKPMLPQMMRGDNLTEVRLVSKVDEIELLLHDVANVQMEVGSSMEHNGTITWSDPIVLDKFRSTYLVPADVPDGLFWHLRFTNITEVTNVVEAGVLVVEDAVQVVTTPQALAWRLDLQGFILYGAIQGGDREPTYA